MTQYLIVCPLVFLAGLVDSIAGGGGLISLPAYLLSGVPIHNAIATNKLSSCIGTSVSTLRYCRNGFADYVTAIPSIIMALIGSSIGAKASMAVDGNILKLVLIFILPVIAWGVLKKKEPASQTAVSHLPRKLVILLSALISFIVGMYDGFYGPGTGSFLLLLYTGICKMDVKTASGNTKLVNLSSNLSALAIYLVHGQALIPLGLASALFCMAGHYMGSGMVMKQGTRIVRPIILMVLVLLLLKTGAELTGFA